MKKAVFLDRDGTIIRDCPYCCRKEDVVLEPGAAEAISLLNSKGVLAIVITNQSGIGRGYFTVRQMEEVNQEMMRQLALRGAHIDGIYFCPHRPDEGCRCRKPSTLLIEKARSDFGTEQEFVIGDRDDIDGEMARRAGLGWAIVGKRSLLEIVKEYLQSGGTVAQM